MSTLSAEVVVTVAGTPAPKGSLKCIGKRGKRGHVLIEDYRPNQKSWRERLTWAAKRITTPAGDKQPVGVEVTLTVDRPPSHRRTGANAHLLRAGAPAQPVGHNTGDVDKLARLVLDALQDGGVLPDDCQVVELVARKTYPGSDTPDALPHPGALLRVYPIGD